MVDIFEMLDKDVVDTSADRLAVQQEQAVEVYQMREELIEVVKVGEAHLLNGKTPWSVKRLEKVSDNAELVFITLGMSALGGILIYNKWKS